MTVDNIQVLRTLKANYIRRKREIEQEIARKEMSCEDGEIDFKTLEAFAGLWHEFRGMRYIFKSTCDCLGVIGLYNDVDLKLNEVAPCQEISTN